MKETCSQEEGRAGDTGLGRGQGCEELERHLKAPHLIGKQRFGGCVRRGMLTHTSRNERFLGKAHPFPELEKRWAKSRSAAPTTLPVGFASQVRDAGSPHALGTRVSVLPNPACHLQPARRGSPLPRSAHQGSAGRRGAGPGRVAGGARLIGTEQREPREGPGAPGAGAPRRKVIQHRPSARPGTRRPAGTAARLPAHTPATRGAPVPSPHASRNAASSATRPEPRQLQPDDGGSAGPPRARPATARRPQTCPRRRAQGPRAPPAYLCGKRRPRPSRRLLLPPLPPPGGS